MLHAVPCMSACVTCEAVLKHFMVALSVLCLGTDDPDIRSPRFIHVQLSLVLIFELLLSVADFKISWQVETHIHVNLLIGLVHKVTVPLDQIDNQNKHTTVLECRHVRKLNLVSQRYLSCCAIGQPANLRQASSNGTAQNFGHHLQTACA